MRTRSSGGGEEWLRDELVDLPACRIGIHRDRWRAIGHAEATPERAAAIMREHRFDVLPVEAAEAVAAYFCSSTWGRFDPSDARPIEAGDVVPHMLSLREVIRRFDGDARHFFFLEEGSSIAGLISLANLNSRRARVYLYDLLAELEIRLAKFVGEHVEESRLLGLRLGGESDRLFAASKKRFEADRKKNLESPFVEYLHLWELLQVCKKAGLRQRLGFSSDAFARARIVNDLRARVAHPVRPIVSKLEDGRLVASALEWIEGALGRLPEA